MVLKPLLSSTLYFFNFEMDYSFAMAGPAKELAPVINAGAFTSKAGLIPKIQ